MVRERDRDRRLDALADHLQHRHVRDQRHAEIAVQQLADPGEELGVERLVEAERGADALELLGRRVVAGEDRGGIAGRQPQQQKHKQRHHAHHGDGGEDAAKQISEHLFPSHESVMAWPSRSVGCWSDMIVSETVRFRIMRGAATLIELHGLTSGHQRSSSASPVPSEALIFAMQQSVKVRMSLQRCQKSRHQPAALGEAVDLDVLVERMRVGAADTEAIEGRDAHRTGEIAV